jgi:hypothetical protein
VLLLTLPQPSEEQYLGFTFSGFEMKYFWYFYHFNGHSSRTLQGIIETIKLDQTNQTISLIYLHNHRCLIMLLLHQSFCPSVCSKQMVSRWHLQQRFMNINLIWIITLHNKMNRIGGAMVSMLASSVLNHWWSLVGSN